MFLRIALLWLVVAAAAQAAPESRLPDYVRPLEYRIEIAPDAKEPVFEGKVEIQFETTRPITILTLNAVELTFDRAEIDGVAAKVAIDPEAQTASFTPPGPVTLGKHVAKFAYRGKIATNEYGLFSSTALSPDGGRKRILATQFESAGARRMIPCFDEPGFKATFDLTAVVQQDDVALGNMPIEASTAEDGRKRVTFARTPRMSSYLLYLGVGDYESIEAEVGNTKVAVWTPRGAIHRARFALDAAVEVLAWYGEYFAQPYPLPKLDLIATPTVGGAMENWGAIRFADSYLLIDDGASQQRRQQVWHVVSHEIAHQWFGDLVTMRWWDDLWLNEGFATWAASASSAALHPEWNMAATNAQMRDGVMQADARRSTHPIVQRITTTAEISAAFDDITYKKGAAVIRMLEAWLTPDVFRTGMRAYMQKHAYGNTVTTDLWDALSAASNSDVRAVADSFTLQPGVPLVTVDRCAGAQGEITLKQQRFAASPSTKLDPQSWNVPVTMATIDGKERGAAVLAQPMLRATLAGCTPARVNPTGTGWYRTVYEPALAKVMAANFTKASATERVVLLDDGWALADAGHVPVDGWLDLASQLAGEREPAVLSAFTEAMTEIDNAARGSKERGPIRSWTNAQLRPVLAQLGWDARDGEAPRDTLAREIVLGALSRFGDAQMRAEARRRYDAAGGDPVELGPLAAIILEAVARGADAATFDRLLEQARNAPTFLDSQQMLNALAAVEDPALLQKFLAATLTDTVPKVARRRLLARTADLGDAARAVWDFSVANVDSPEFGTDTRRRWSWAPAIGRRLDQREQAAMLRDYGQKKAGSDERPQFERAAEEIELRAERRARVVPAVAAWIAAHGKS